MTEHSTLSIKALNFNYLQGKKVVCYLNNNTEETIANDAIIFDIDDKKMKISITNNEEFKKGTPIIIEFLYKENLLRVKGDINKYNDGILSIRINRTAEKIQQREHLRVGCNIKCSIENYATGRIKNLSAGGAYILIDSPINKNYINENLFKVNFKIMNKELRITSKAIEITPSFIRVSFHELDSDREEFLTQYCCNKNSIEYRGTR